MEHYDHNDTKQHFYAACVAGWATDANLVRAIEKLKKLCEKDFKKGNMYMWIIHVPLPPDAHYKIENYVPVVEGSIKIFEGWSKGEAPTYDLRPIRSQKATRAAGRQGNNEVLSTDIEP